MVAMSEPSSISAVIDLWPTRRALADDVQITQDRVHKWAQVEAIPAKYHLAVIQAAAARGFPVTADLLARLHAKSEAAA